MILLILVKLVFFCETGDSDESGDSSDSSYYGYSDRKCDIWLTNNASKKGKRVVVVLSTICKILQIVTHKKLVVVAWPTVCKILQIVTHN